LAPDDPTARLLGLTLWITQESVWSPGPHTPRTFSPVDVAAVAWFDDLEVRRLPRVALEAAGDAPLFVEGRLADLLLTVEDADGFNLSAELTVHDANRRLVFRQPVPIHTAKGAAPHRVTLPALPVGIYQAGLSVLAQTKPLSRTTLDLAVLGPPLADGRPPGGRLGVILREASRQGWLLNTGYLKELAVGYVKVPLRGDDWTTPAAATLDQPFDEFLDWLTRNRVTVVAELREPTFLGTPVDTRGRRPLIDVLGDEPSSWLPYVGYFLSRYADVVSGWQLGADGDTAAVWDDRLPGLLPGLRRRFGAFLFDPRLITTWSIEHQLSSARATGDQVCVRLPNTLAPDCIHEYWQSLPPDERGRYWAYVEPLPEGRYPATARAADYAFRLVAALRTGAGNVFVPQPWNQPAGFPCGGGPTEDFLILRTVAGLLGDARWVGAVRLDATATADIFDRGGSGVLVVRDESSPATPRMVSTYVGQAARVIDLHGNLLSAAGPGGLLEVPVSAEPLFVDGVQSWLMRVRGSVRLESDIIDTARGPQTRVLKFTNHAGAPVSGTLHLAVPRFWEVKPQFFPFHLQPGASFQGPLTIRVPANESAGDKLVQVRMALDTAHSPIFDIPLPVKLALPDVEVATAALTVDDTLVVRQRLTNRSPEMLSFDGFVLAPGRPRISRSIPNLSPGQTVTKEYYLPRAGELIGKALRVGLYQVRGNRHHSEMLLVH